MTHFEGWENTWASFDDYTVAAFRKATGLDARHDLKLGDFNDPNFRKWVDFRIRTITDFMHEIRDCAYTEVNPLAEVRVIKVAQLQIMACVQARGLAEGGNRVVVKTRPGILPALEVG